MLSLESRCQGYLVYGHKSCHELKWANVFCLYCLDATWNLFLKVKHKSEAAKVCDSKQNMFWNIRVWNCIPFKNCYFAAFVKVYQLGSIICKNNIRLQHLSRDENCLTLFNKTLLSYEQRSRLSFWTNIVIYDGRSYIRSHWFIYFWLLRVVSETLSKSWDFLVALSAPLMTRLLRLPNITTTIFLFFDRFSHVSRFSKKIENKILLTRNFVSFQIFLSSLEPIRPRFDFVLHRHLYRQIQYKNISVNCSNLWISLQFLLVSYLGSSLN